MQRKRAAGEEIDLTQLGMMTDRLGRVLQRLGLEPQLRDDLSDPKFEPVTVEIVLVEPKPRVVSEPPPPPVIDHDPDDSPPVDMLPPPLPAPLTSDEKMRQHDAERAAWTAREMARAAQRPPSPWASDYSNSDVGPYSLNTNWSDTRR